MISKQILSADERSFMVAAFFSQLSFLNCIFFSPATSIDKGECMGGSTLSLLHDKTFNYTGDSQAQELCLYLTKAASVPYFEILEKWIYRGIINDPYRYPEESCSFFLLGIICGIVGRRGKIPCTGGNGVLALPE